MRLHIALVLSLISLIVQSYGQTNNHVVSIEQFIQPNIQATVVRCSGAIISIEHVIATASCATVQAPFDLAVRLFVTISPGVTSETITAVGRVSFHPEYTRTQSKEFNIAVLRTLVAFNPALSPPRPLGGLRANSLCRLFGWGSRDANPRSDLITVFGTFVGSTFCDPNNPGLFCTLIFLPTNPTCSAHHSSPVICSIAGDAVDGLLLNEGSCYDLRSWRFLLQYISVGPHRDWINCEVASSVPCDIRGNNGTATVPPATTLPPPTTLSGMTVKASVTLIVSALLSAIFLKN